MDKPLESVTHGQYDAKPIVTFLAADISALRLVPNYIAWLQRHRRRVWTTCPLTKSGTAWSRTRDVQHPDH